MARFLPYDQTGFGRFDARPYRQAFGTGAKWLGLNELAQQQDLDKPAGLKAALATVGLAKGIVESPLTDLATKGVGEVIKAVKPTPKSKYKSLIEEEASLRGQAKGMLDASAAKKKKRKDEIDSLTRRLDNIRKKATGGSGAPFVGDPRTNPKAPTNVYVDGVWKAGPGVPAPEGYADLMARLKQLKGVQEDETPAQKARELEQRAAKLRQEADLMGMMKNVGSLDDLFAMIMQPNATRAHLEAALKVVGRFSPAPTLTQIRTGVKPADAIRQRLIKAFFSRDRMQLTPYERGKLDARESDRQRKLAVDRARERARREKIRQSRLLLQAQLKRIAAGTNKTLAAMAQNLLKGRFATTELALKSLVRMKRVMPKKTMFQPLVDQLLEDLGYKGLLGEGGGRRRRPVTPPVDGGDNLDWAKRYKKNFAGVRTFLGGKKLTVGGIDTRIARLKQWQKSLSGLASGSKKGKGDIRKKRKKGQLFLSPREGRLAEELAGVAGGLIKDLERRKSRVIYRKKAFNFRTSIIRAWKGADGPNSVGKLGLSRGGTTGFYISEAAQKYLVRQGKYSQGAKKAAAEKALKLLEALQKLWRNRPSK
jgi:hypothetical protein